MLSGNLNGETHIKGTRAGIPMPKRQKQISQLDIKKEKIRL